MYERLVKGLKEEEGHGDSVHAASWVAIELGAASAALLLFILFARLIHPLLALPAFILGLAAISGRNLTQAILRENDARFQTLLFYLIICFAAFIIVVGWSRWM